MTTTYPQADTLTIPTWPAAHSPVPPRYFAADHWRLLGRYASSFRANPHDELRCDPARHPFLISAGSHLTNDAAAPTPTQVVGPHPGTTALLVDHDDYDCIDDLVAAGLLEVVMPTPDPLTDTYTAPDGRVCVVDDVALRPSFPTPLATYLLARFADFIPTAKGSFIAAALTDIN